MGLAVLLTAGSGAAATKTYSSGPLARTIAPAAASALDVRDRGPVSSVAVAVRIDTPAAADLRLVLRSPAGTRVVLAANRGGAGANFGTGKGCSGILAVFDEAYGPPVREGRPPFTESPSYVPDEKLARLRGEEAGGRWSLEVESKTGRGPSVLRCWRLTISRDIVEHRVARGSGVEADLSFRERSHDVFGVHLRIARNGRRTLDASLGEVNCRECSSRGLLFVEQGNPVKVRDLDADGEPEVLLGLYTGGAHCCFYTLVFRYRPHLGD